MKIGIDYKNKYDEYEVPENIGRKVVDLLEKWVEAQKITLKDTNPGDISLEVEKVEGDEE